MTEPPTTGPVRVVVVDDHVLFGAALDQLLGDAGGFDVVGHATTAAQAVDLVERLQPGVVLVDVLLPDGSGLDVCRRLVSDRPSVRVVVITSFGGEVMVRGAAAAGAWAFVAKQIDGTDLVRTLRRVGAGERLLHPRA